MKSPKKKKKEEAEEIEEFDFRSGMGILPDDIPLTKNIGCVGGSNKKAEKKEK
ncbi:hypothetical protein [Algoriphagus sp. CAU 1675]|uniref:hypothetical protein n=1 Tax=Algoriphagus sp. CAU 1675 TaxID=3032597 RepID=UPI0023DBB497|nr:hypothetical protein [Algoriphagus sp. CAU 1675]MDF2156226.1 hypothetical protein [Algoriphagus sp. CAU 1675]